MPGIGLPKGGDTHKSDTGASFWHVFGDPVLSTIGAQATTRGVIFAFPFSLQFPTTVTRFFFASNTIGSGRYRAAIYNDAGNTPAAGVKVPGSDSGATTIPDNKPSSGTFIAPLPLAPGRYWFAVSASTSAVSLQIGGSVLFKQRMSATASYRAGSLASSLIRLPDPFPAAVTLDGPGAMPLAIRAQR